MNNVGATATDPLTLSGTNGNFMKASFAQFLSLRHGGSGYVFSYGGSLNTGQNFSIYPPNVNPNAPVPPNAVPADRPYHSLSYPDIDYTVLRPAALPPSTYTDPQQQVTAAAGYAGDPGLKNPFQYAGYATGTVPVSPNATGVLTLPPAIPTRRLFQIPDDYPGSAGTGYSNAGETGDPYNNNQKPATTGNPAPGALPPFVTGGLAGVSHNVTDSVATIYWPGFNMPTGPGFPTNPYLGLGTGGAGIAGIDDRQHPYFRSETLQETVNLTTSRTHQYAVWITVGFFEVRRQGDLLMAAAGAGTQAATLAYDILGPEVGASTGATTRYRSFFIVDRLKLTAYDPNVIGSFRPAVVHRQAIE
jgi:hypothetical protein